MRRKRTIYWLVVLVALLMVRIAWAQGPPPPSPEGMEQRERERMAEMSERLELTEEQEQQVQPILDDAAEQMRAKHGEFRSRGRSRATHEAMQKEMQKVEKATRERLVPILSAEQLEEYDKLRAEWARERKEHQSGRQRGGGRG